MSGKLVGLDEVLLKLRDRGPQPTHDIAYEFGLNPLDARMLLLHAHVSGLVVRNDWGEWKLTERGREAIGPAAEAQQESGWRPKAAAWRPGWRSGALAAACVGASVAVVSVAGGFSGSSAVPVASGTVAHEGSHPPLRTEVRLRRRKHRPHLVRTFEYVHPGRTLIARVTRSDSRSTTLRWRPPVLPPQLGLQVGGTKAGSSSTTSVRVAAVRRASGTSTNPDTQASRRHKRKTVGSGTTK